MSATATARLPPRALPLAAGIALLAGVAVALLSRGGDAPLAVEPLRVTSDGAIATAFPVGDGRAVTVAHVFDGERDRGLAVEGARAEVLRVDRRSDLALLAVPRLRGDSPGVAREPVAAAELRLGRVRDGRTSWLPVESRRSIDAHVRAPGAERPITRPSLELGTPGRALRAGDSGAPVVTESGALAGVLFAVSRSRADTAYAVDAEALARLLRPLSR